MTRVAVFIDWQNAYMSARRAFGWTTMPSEYGNFSPGGLGKLLASRNGRGNDGQLCLVEVHRGLPSAGKQAMSHGACRKQASAWEAECDLVSVNLRPIRYPHDWPTGKAMEKGVDVQLALGVIGCCLDENCDVAILVSNDTDLVPAIEMVADRLSPQRIETASWRSPTHSARLRTNIPGVFHNYIDATAFGSIADLTNYAYKGPET